MLFWESALINLTCNRIEWGSLNQFEWKICLTFAKVTVSATLFRLSEFRVNFLLPRKQTGWNLINVTSFLFLGTS